MGNKGRNPSSGSIAAPRTMTMESTAVISGSFLSGSMINISLLAVPVLLDTNTEASQLVNQWVRVYHYGHMLLPAISVSTCLLYSYACYKNRQATRPWRIFAAAAVVTMIMIPFTWIFMAPTNNKLFGADAQFKAGQTAIDLAEAHQLLRTWNSLHITRSFFPLAGAVLGLVGSRGIWVI